MALNYSLKYKKLNFFNRVLLEKEGEIIIDRNCFRLKGKGANDHGEIVYFGDINKISVLNEDEIIFTTFKREQYKLSNFSNLFLSFLKDFYRVRNEYLAESLQMKVGMLYKEYDGQASVIDASGNADNKSMVRIQFYEGSVVIMPEVQECFVVYLNFLKSYEFDENEYVLRFYLEDKSTVQISKLGSSFGDARETFEMLLSKMYERIVNNLKIILPDFQAAELLKLAYIIRDDKLVNLNSLKKINENLPQKIEKIILGNNQIMNEKIAMLKRKSPSSRLYTGFICSSKSDDGDLTVKSWFLCVLPEYNLIATGVYSKDSNADIYFLRIALEEGDVDNKLNEKISGLNQCMFLFKHDLEPLYQNKHQLLKSRYRILFMKLPFLKNCRASCIGKSIAKDTAFFQKEIDQFCARATTYYKNSAFSPYKSTSMVA